MFNFLKRKRKPISSIDLIQAGMERANDELFLHNMPATFSFRYAFGLGYAKRCIEEEQNKRSKV